MVMITNNIKAILFASVIVAMILPFSSMNVAEAQVQKENTLFEKFLKLADKQQKIQNKLDKTEHSRDALHKDKLQNNIDRIQKKMDRLQNQYYDSIYMSDEELRALDEEGLMVFNELSDPNSPLYVGVAPNSYFVSQISKETQLMFDTLESTTKSLVPSKASAALTKIQSNDNKGELNGMVYTIDVPQKISHFVSCSDREDDCNYLMGGLAVDQNGEKSTMSFWAKHDNGDIGFVMTAHGANGLGKLIEQYPHRDVGTVDVITSAAWGQCDCAFVDATETVVKKVFYASNVAKTITSYSSSNPSVGTWLQISGVTSGTIYGTFDGIHSTYGMLIDADVDGGDSGAPVTTIGSTHKVYGMVHGSNGAGNTAYATTYADIKSALDLQ